MAVRQPRVEPLGVIVDRDIRAQGGMPWSDSPLSWGEFRGPAPATPGDRGAETAYTLFHAVRCTGVRFEFRVVSALVPAKSWVSSAVLRDSRLSARTLRHEQTHFDLSEVHARRLRRHFAQLSRPCARTEAELGSLAARFLQDEAAAQQRYDRETSHGRLGDRQLGWDADVAKQLLMLAKFADPE